MEITQIIKLIDTPDELIKKVQAYRAFDDKDHEHLQYEPENQPVLNKAIRKDKEVKKPNGLKDEEGNDQLQTFYEAVARIPVAFQKIIVSRAIMFLTGALIEREANAINDVQKNLVAMVEKTWEDNKFDYKLDEIAEAMMSQKGCAVIFHFDEADEDYWGELGATVNSQNMSRRKLRHSIISRGDGSVFYPVFNEVNDMTAFGREYEREIDNETKEQRMDIYTAQALFRYVKNSNSTWEPYTASYVDKNGDLQQEKWPLENPVKKIPVIWFPQKRVEWADVQWAIDQYVTTFSDLSETNKYFGSPIMKAKGEIKGMASKGEQGKIFEMDKEADLEYITWNQAPESVRLELDTLKDIIYTITQTPDITFKELKGIGDLSGVALRMMFLDPHAKASRKHKGNYGEGVHRMLNYIKAAMAVINVNMEPAVSMTIKPKFKMFIPENVLEELEIVGKKIENGNLATNGKVSMAQETAIENNPLVKDPKKEIGLIKKEAAEAQKNLVSTNLFEDPE